MLRLITKDINMNIDKNFDEEIRTWFIRCRKKLKMNQKEFADFLGISQGQVSKIEKGVAFLRASELLCCAQKVNSRIDWIIDILE